MHACHRARLGRSLPATPQSRRTALRSSLGLFAALGTLPRLAPAALAQVVTPTGGGPMRSRSRDSQSRLGRIQCRW